MSNKPFPPAFAVQCVQDCWFAISPSHRPHDRTLDRQALRADDCRLLTVTDEIPSVPEPPALPRLVLNPMPSRLQRYRHTPFGKELL